MKELHGERISVRHIKAFFREAVLSTKLEHENILKFYVTKLSNSSYANVLLEGACVQPPEFLMSNFIFLFFRKMNLFFLFLVLSIRVV